MEYTSIFDAIPWNAIGHSVIQTFTLYWLLIFGLKAVGRRVFAEMGPQDLIILLLIAEACDLGLTDERAGYWGTMASVLTILATGGIIERVPVLRKLHSIARISSEQMNGKPSGQATIALEGEPLGHGSGHACLY